MFTFLHILLQFTYLTYLPKTWRIQQDEAVCGDDAHIKMHSYNPCTPQSTTKTHTWRIQQDDAVGGDEQLVLASACHIHTTCTPTNHALPQSTNTHLTHPAINGEQLYTIHHTTHLAHPAE